MYFGLDGRVSARVQHFTGMNFRNMSHGTFFILQINLGFGQAALENMLAGRINCDFSSGEITHTGIQLSHSPSSKRGIISEACEQACDI